MKGEDSDFDAMREELAKLRADVAGFADHLRSFSTAAAGAARRATQEKGEELREDIDGTIDDLLKQGNETLKDTKARIEERPLTAVLIALLVGFVLARLLDRR